MNQIFMPVFRTGLLIFLFLKSTLSWSQVLINEICPSNISNKLNENGEYDDWIEIYNDGNSSVNMGGYGLSDVISEPYKFVFPNFNLDAHQKILVFASGINRTDLSNHWETAVSAQTTWKYFVGTSAPDTNWRNLNFNHASWSSGTGGIGFGDGDDNTTIATCKSVMMRKEFFIPDTGNIASAVFNIDYDDGFVAFLNGVEIARANLGTAGDRPDHNVLASSSHEAMMYQGHDPDSFYIAESFLKSILLPGVNVIAVQVHNQSATSGDLSAIPFLSFGMLNSTQTFSSTPSWFRSPGFQYFQANFKLSRDGETVLLTDNTGFTLDQQDFTRMDPNHSTGRSSDGSSSWCVFTSPTPLGSNSNSTCYPGYASDPVFSISEGFYSSTRTLSLSTSLSGAKIRYTTDGSEPTSSSTQYSNSISISSTKTIRVKVFKTGYLPSPTFTKTYFIGEDIDLPVFTISTAPDNLWNYNTGIYATGPNADSAYPYNGANFWQDWEKPAGVEYFDKNKVKQAEFQANIEIFGNYSQAKPQKSFEIKLSDDMGTSSVNYAFYPDKPQITSTDNIVLRNAGTEWNKVHFRDALMERVMKTTHSGYLATQPAVLFLNGEYWGVYTIHENHDQHWIKNNYGLGKDEIDYLLENSNVSTKYGSDDSFWDMVNYAKTQTPNGTNYYNDMNEMLDIENFVDYMIAETYFNNGDWMGDWTNNIKMWRPRASGGKWRYILYDLDFGLGYSGSVNDNRIAVARNPVSQNEASDMFDAMLQNSKFKNYFINRYADLINTIYKSSTLISSSQEFEDEMRHDMSDHFAKWPSFNGDNFSISTWNSRISSMESFISSRPGKVRGHIQTEFSLPSQVTLTLNVSPAGSGRIQISTVNPTSFPWTGVYFRGNPVTITAMPNPGYTFDHWRSNVVISSNNSNQVATYDFTSTDQITAYFSGSSQSPKITISEINYHSASSQDAGDWIELHNYGNVDLDISNWKLKDRNDYNAFTFPTGTVIDAGDYLVISEDLIKFSAIFPQVNNVIGPMGFNLDNSGDVVRVFDYLDQNIIEADFDDNTPWPTGADGQGYTLELLSNTGNLNSSSNWFLGCMGGSPGRQYSAPTANVSLSGPSEFCVGGSVDLNCNSVSGNEYQWFNNGVFIPGANQNSYTASVSGTYTVRVSNQGCSVQSSSVSLSTIPYGQTPVTTGSFHCGPGTVTLIAQASDTVFWYDISTGNLLGTGSSFTTPVLFTSAGYWARSSSVCPSAPAVVLADIINTASAPLAQDAFTCGSGSVTLSATATEPISWYDAATGGNLVANGPVFNTPIINSSTPYYVVAGVNCPSSPLLVNALVYAQPNVYLGIDTAIESGHTLLLDAGSSFASYQWSTGQSSQTIVVSTAGTYSVLATDFNNCTASDDIDVTTFLGISANSFDITTFRAFPLPVKDKVTIEYFKQGNTESLLQVYNSEGRLLHTESIHAKPGPFSLELNIQHYSSGIYFLSLTDANKTRVILLPVK